MVNKVRVYGKAQNRTVLGIVHAYLVMYPHATLEDIRKAFPVELNPYYGDNEFLFYDKKEPIKGYTEEAYKWNVFTEKEEIIHLQDGTEVYFMKMWRADAFDNICKHAKQYGIEIADFKPKQPFQKGGFQLEYLNGYVPPIPQIEKKKPNWLVLSLIIIGLIAALLFFLFNKNNPEVIEKTVVITDTVTIADTVYVQAIEKIETEFNAAQFPKGKADLNDDAKFVLHDLSKLLENHPDIKLKIIGHTSDEGSQDFNQKLSEARAKTAVDFLISKGIAAERLSYEGKGSSEPKDENNREVNRRTEFEIIK